MVRVIDWLRERGLSNRNASAALQTGKVLLRNVPTSEPTRLANVEDLRVWENAPRLRPGLDPFVLHKDDDLLVVVKPSGMLSVPAKGRSEASVYDVLSQKMGRLFIVHRLDEGTGGLMMFARTESAQTALKDQLFVHETKRIYQAIVFGEFPDEAKTVTSFLIRNRGDGLRGSGTETEGKKAVTSLRCLERSMVGKMSLVEASLTTGRTHQVRIHLAEEGFPVVGDNLYGRDGDSASRLALHAVTLGLVHPRSKESLLFESPLSDAMDKTWRRLNTAAPSRQLKKKRYRH